jgi:hypothetical protein
MASSIANHCFPPYNGTHVTTDGFRNGYPIPEEYFFAFIFPHHGYTVFQEETASSTPAYSIGTRPGLPISSTGLAQNIDGGFNISERSYDMWPSDNQSILTDQINCGLSACDLTPSFVVPDNSPSTFNLHSHLVPTRDMWTEAVGSFDISATGILNNDPPLPVSESFFFGRQGWYPTQHFIASKQLSFNSATG